MERVQKHYEHCNLKFRPSSNSKTQNGICPNTIIQSYNDHNKD